MPTEEPSASTKLTAASAVKVDSLIDYAAQSIVSRALAESESGSLTLFAFDAGQSLSEHTAPFDAFVQVVDGRVELKIGGRQVTASRGQIVLMPADVPHAVRARERFKMLLFMLRSA